MNTSNKIIFLSFVFCVSTLSILGLSFIKSADNSDSVPNNDTVPQINEVKNAESNISPRAGEKADTEKYLIRITDNEIKAYIIDSTGGELMWNSVSIPPDLSPDERDKLQNGIYTDSFEELCLYFEAYAS